MDFSTYFANLRHLPSQAKVRSTTQRRGNTSKPLARWLLMCHDRLQDNNLPLTHEFLALMLGVRRSGVTNEIHVIEGVHAIKATRGNIKILDRAKLEDMAGGSYGIPEREYERHIGFPIRRS